MDPRLTSSPNFHEVKPREEILFPTGGFLYNRQKQEILLHLRDGKTPYNPNKWAFFGGMSKKGETPAECFVREMYEEIGLLFSVENVILFREYYQEDSGWHKYEFFICSDADITTMILGEGAGFKWIPLNEVFAYNLSPRTREGLTYFVQQVLR
ncbi:MAG: hypothetical protein COU90_02210 [Candidatus Ryanbacteria bacterium CG10_big_fil_rev_8_21_14_0_10_43_42]|uniref:Nudix hydrolase domain-containing protein n=1 Tax=Candidatus Ryanbacteria bacterium CG10_big_fil_rev_8_21_14_0_10_43_42 TaxID=1974864 RepID=A0A2M8KXM7_9BACT|nr:MAG: hypothetical protein COU90_02210 [Candidatus Ryanbacteria bacterium CG10_big_fil_rev_8_21_14_0_10_43_42]